jgi:hypothetical protein
MRSPYREAHSDQSAIFVGRLAIIFDLEMVFFVGKKD